MGTNGIVYRSTKTLKRFLRKCQLYVYKATQRYTERKLAQMKEDPDYTYSDYKEVLTAYYKEKAAMRKDLIKL